MTDARSGLVGDTAEAQPTPSDSSQGRFRAVVGRVGWLGMKDEIKGLPQRRLGCMMSGDQEAMTGVFAKQCPQMFAKGFFLFEGNAYATELVEVESSDGVV